MNSTVRDIGSYPETGVVVLPELLGPNDIALLSNEADRIRDHVVSRALSESNSSRLTWWRLPDGDIYLFKIKPVVDLSVSITALSTYSRIMSALARLGHAQHLPMEDKITYKQRITLPIQPYSLPTLGEDVRKHTDGDYFTRRGYHDVVSVAVLLDDCTAESGPLCFWPGTHNRKIVAVPTADQGPVIDDVEAPDSDAVPILAPAGSVVLWDARLVHASGPNTSGRPRRLIVFGYAPDINRGS